jgi:hypothetical protein
MGKGSCRSGEGESPKEAKLALTVGPYEATTDDSLDDRLLRAMDQVLNEEITPAVGNTAANLARTYIDRQRLRMKCGQIKASMRVTAVESVPDPRAEKIRELERELAALKAAG